MAAPRTFYELLDIPPDASAVDVEAGYQRAQEAFSSDGLAAYALFTPEEAEHARREVELAFDVLRRPRARAAYDAALSIATDKSAATAQFATRMREDSLLGDPVGETAPEQRRAPTGRLVIAAAVEEAPDPSATQPPLPNMDPGPSLAEELPLVDSSLLQTVPPPPAEPPVVQLELAPLPPPGPALAEARAPATVLPTSVPVSLSPTAPPAPAQVAPPAAPAPRKFRRMRLDDDSMSLSSARANPPSVPPMPAEVLPLPEDGEINGAVLQRLRESRGITLKVMAEATKLSVHYLQALESNEFGELPGRVYLRGFLIQYARALKVPSDRLANGYLVFADRFRNQLR